MQAAIDCFLAASQALDAHGPENIDATTHTELVGDAGKRNTNSTEEAAASFLGRGWWCARLQQVVAGELVRKPDRESLEAAIRRME